MVQGKLNLAAPQGNVNLSTKTLYVAGSGQIASQNLTICPQTKFNLGTNITDNAPALKLKIQDTMLNQGEVKASGIEIDAIQHWANRGIIYPQKDFHLNAQTIHNTGELIANQGGVQLSAQYRIQNENISSSAGHLSLAAKEELRNTGTLKSGQHLAIIADTLHNDGTITSHQAANIQAPKALHNEHTIYSAQAMDIQAGVLYNAGQIKAVKDLCIKPQAVHNTHVIISEKGKIVLTVQGNFNNNHVIQSAQSLELQAQGDIVNQGTLVAKDSMQLEGQSINNLGIIGSNESNTKIKAKACLYNTETILGKTQLHIIAQEGIIENKGQFIAHQGLHAQGKDLINTGRIHGGAGNIRLVGQKKIDNKHAINSIGDIQLNAACLSNEGLITTSQVLQATASQVDNSGTIHSKEQLSLKAQRSIRNEQRIISDQTLTLEATNIDNLGELYAPTTLAITTRNLHNQGKIRAATILPLSTDQLTLHNMGDIQAHADLILNTYAIHNTGSITVSPGSLTLRAQETIHNAKTIQSAGNLAITAGAALVNQENLQSAQHIAIKAQSLNNTGMIASQTGDVSLVTQQGIYNEQIIASHKTLDIQGSSLNNQGVIIGEVTTITAQQDIINEQDIAAKYNLVLRAGETLHNHNIAQITASQNLTLEAKTIHNQGSITSELGSSNLEVANQLDHPSQACKISAKQKLHNAGTIQTQGSLMLTCNAIDNAGYIIANTGTLALKAHKAFDNQQVIRAGHNLEIQTEQILKNQGKLMADHNLTLQAKTIHNYGQIAGKEQTTLATTAHIYNEQTILSGKNLRLATKNQLVNRGQLAASQDLTLQARTLISSGEIIGGTGTTSLATHAKLVNKNTIISEGDLCLAASSQVLNQAVIKASKSLSIKSKTVANQGIIELASGSLQITAQAGVYNRKCIASEQDLSIQAQAILVNLGTLEARNLQLIAPSLFNKGAINNGAGMATLKIQDTIQNQQEITSLGHLDVTTTQLLNSHQLAAQGPLKLDAQTISNKEQGLIASNTMTTISASGSIHNQGQIQGTQLLDITTNELTNAGELQAQDKAILKIQDIIWNQQEITSLGQLDITTTQLLNSHQLAAQGPLKLDAQTISNKEQGLIASNTMTTISASGSIHNQGQIQGTQLLDITTNELTNAGGLCARDGVGITTRGSLLNKGNIKASQGAMALTSISGTIANSSHIIAAGPIRLEATRLDNGGEIVSHEGETRITTQDALTNHHTIYAGKDLYIKAAKALTNAKNSHLVAARSMTLKAGRLDNGGEIVSHEGKARITTQDALTNHHTIYAGKDLYIKAAKALANTKNSYLLAPNLVDLQADDLTNHGEITSQDIRIITTAGPIKNYHKIIGIRQIQLTASTVLDNVSHIESGGNLQISATRVTNVTTENQAIIKAQDCHIQTSVLENIGRLAASQNLHITSHHLTNQRYLPGSKGDNTIQVQGGKPDDYHWIGSAKNLHIVAKTLENHGQITANDSLTLTLNTLHNKRQGNITGGCGTTALTIQNKLINEGLMASVQDLSITIQGGGFKNQGQLKAQGSLSLKALDLHNTGPITGGQGKTLLEIQGDIDNYNLITSTHRLRIQTRRRLHNEGQIAAGERLDIHAQDVQNKTTGKIQGGQRNTSRIETTGDINNYGFLTSDGSLALQVAEGGVYNQGMIQGSTGLIITARDVANMENKTIFSGQDLTMELKNRLYNDKGEIFSQGNMRLQGQANQPIEEIRNNIGKIESMGNMTLQAQNLYNKGYVNYINYTIYQKGYSSSYCTYASSSWNLVESTCGVRAWGPNGNWYIYDDAHEEDGWSGARFSREERAPEVSSECIQQAHIQARGKLSLHINRKIYNYGSIIVAGQDIAVEGNPSINNETPATSVCLHDAFIYEKNWINICPVNFLWLGRQKFECVRKYREYKYFSLHATTPTLFRSGHHMYIQARELRNGAPITHVQVAHQASPVEQLAATQSISILPHITLPTSEHSLFKVNIGIMRASSHPTAQAKPSLAVSVTLPAWPTYEEAPTGAHRTRPIEQPQVIMPQGAIPHDPSPTTPAELAAPTYELPEVAVTDRLVTAFQGTADHFAPQAPNTQIKLPLPPHTYLIEANVKVDMQKFYGSPYFIKKVGIQTDKPLRFLGDPFYESRLINESILKATTQRYLNDDVATDEEQVKYLIDNAASVSEDLQLSLGVALSKEQIHALNKDILWYVEETVHDQQVLTPQIYLSQATLQRLKSPTGTGLHAGKQMQLDIKNTLTNTGNISARSDLQVHAGRINNETIGPNQAKIQSTGGLVSLEAEGDIINRSAAITSHADLQLTSKQGSIVHTTKLINDSTLAAQATLTSGGRLLAAAQKNIISQGARIKARKQAVLKAAEGDVKFLTQELRHQHSEEHRETSSQSGLFGSRSSTKITQKNYESVQHEASALDIGESLTIAGRDVEFVGTQVKVQEHATIQASRDFHAIAAQDLTKTHEQSEKTTHRKNLIRSKTASASYERKREEVRNKLAQFNIGGSLAVEAGHNITMIGTELTANQVKLQAQNEIDLRDAYDTVTAEAHSTTDQQRHYLGGLFKNDHGQRESVQENKRTLAGGNQWRVNQLHVAGKRDVHTESLKVRGRDQARAQDISIISTQGKVHDHKAEGYEKNTRVAHSYKVRQGLLGIQGPGQGGRVGSVKLYEKEEEDKRSAEVQTKATSSSFSTKDISVKSASDQVILEGTHIDASGDGTIAGKKGVQILDIEEQATKESHTETKTAAWSLGLRNKFLSIGQDAQAWYEAAKQVKATKNAYSQHQKQLKQFAKHHAQGLIPTSEYNQLQAEGSLHLAAISTSVANLAAKTKQLSGDAVRSLSSISSGGFNLDGRASMERLVEDFFSTTTRSKGANIQVKNLKIEAPEGSLTIRGSHVASQDLSIEAQDVLLQAGKSSGQQRETQTGSNLTLSAELPSGLGSLGLQAMNNTVSASRSTSESQKENKTHHYAHIHATNIKLNVKGNANLVGGKIHASEHMAGTIGGHLHIETLQNTSQGKGRSHQQSLSPGQGNIPGISLGAGFGASKSDQQWAAEQSAFTAGGRFELAVGGKTYNTGGRVGSESGETRLVTEAYVATDLDDHQFERQANAQAGLGISAHSPSSKFLFTHGHATVAHSYSRTRQKT